MRVLITLTPATGSLHPLVPVARSLTAGGHHVAFVSAPSARRDVEEHGFPFFPGGVDWHASNPRYIEILCRAAGGLTFPPLTGEDRFRWVVEHLFIGGAARRMLPDVMDVIGRWQPDLVLRESLEFSGCVAAEASGLPHASVAAAADSALDERERLAPPLAALRGDVGLRPDLDAAMPYRHLSLCFAPPSFHGAAARLPSSARFFRHELAPRHGTLPPQLRALPARPTVVVSLGTVFHRTSGLVEAIVAGLRSMAINLVVAMGFDQDPGRLGPQPPHVHVEPWLPLDQLPPSANVLVTHGGFNTVKEAITLGIPMVVIPIADDQPYAAERCAALGLAEVVDPDQRSPTRIRDAAQAVVDDDRYRQRAVALSAQMAALPPLASAVALLETLLATAGAPRNRAGRAS